jgi:hypothetical protein
MTDGNTTSLHLGTSHCTEQTSTVIDVSAFALRQIIYGIHLNEGISSCPDLRHMRASHRSIPMLQLARPAMCMALCPLKVVLRSVCSAARKKRYTTLFAGWHPKQPSTGMFIVFDIILHPWAMATLS